MQNLKKKLVTLAESYLNTYPVPADIFLFENSLKLSYSFTVPSANTKNVFETIYPLPFPKKTMEVLKAHNPVSERLKFDEKSNKM